MMDIDISYSRGGFKLAIKCLVQDAVIGLYGHSGSGKSTLLNILAGFLNPSIAANTALINGHFIVGDTVLYDAKSGVNVPPHLRRIGSVFQDSRLFPHLTVMQNLNYGLALLPKQRQQISVTEVVELLEIADLLPKRPHQLSGGEGQRIALGRALLMSPQLLLLDEPLSSLDSRLKKQILPFLKRVKDETNIPMVYVSHDIDEINFLTSNVLTIENGQIV